MEEVRQKLSAPSGSGSSTGLLRLEQPELSLLQMARPTPLISFLLFVPPEADATLLKKPEKLLAGLDRGGPPPAPGAPRRRGSMPVPYKHQLRRAQAIDELDWPPQASSSGSSDSLGSGEAAPTQKDGIFKVMLVGESGVGKSTLAGTFGGLQGDSAHELENPGIWGSPGRVEGTSGALLRDGRAQGMCSPRGQNLETVPVLSVATSLEGVPVSQLLQVLGSLLMGSLPWLYFPTEDTYERRITVDKEEVTLVVYDIWEQVRTQMWLQADDETWENRGGAKSWLKTEGWYPGFNSNGT